MQILPASYSYAATQNTINFFATSGPNVTQMHSLRKLEMKNEEKNSVRKNPDKYAKHSVAFVHKIVRIKCVSKRKCHERKNIMAFEWTAFALNGD